MPKRNRNQTVITTEHCPFCENESDMTKIVEPCQHCGHVISACSLCTTEGPCYSCREGSNFKERTDE